MKYLLDTCVISDFIKGYPAVLNKIKHTPPSEIAVSSISVMEVQYGLALHPKRVEKYKPVITDFFKAVHILNFDENDALYAAISRAYLKQQGTPIGAYDILLAGTAIQRNLILVSSNTKEFERINNLKLTDWRLTKV